MTEADIRTALRDCYDPAIPCNIVDLGLVQTITLQPDADAPGSGIPGVPAKHRVAIAVTATDPTEDAEARMTAQIVNRLAAFETVSHTTVTILRSPPWTPQAITPAGRKTLGLDGNPTLVQIR